MTMRLEITTKDDDEIEHHQQGPSEDDEEEEEAFVQASTAGIGKVAGKVGKAVWNAGKNWKIRLPFQHVCLANMWSGSSERLQRWQEC